MRFPVFLPFVNFLGRVYSFLGQAWAEGKRGACNEPPLRGLWTGKPGKNVRRHGLYRSNASMIKQKKILGDGASNIQTHLQAGRLSARHRTVELPT